MEKLEIQKQVQNTYYLKSASDFSRLDEIIGLMPNYDTISRKQGIVISDYFYETPDRLLENLDASIRIRQIGDQQTLSIVCKTDGKRREFETSMNYGDKIQDKIQYILFLEDKLQDIYTHRIDADIARMLKSLRVFLQVETYRTQLEVINNSGFNGLVNFDSVVFNTKRHKVQDNVLEVKLNCLNDVGNMTAYNRFCHELEQKVLLLPMQETKFEAGKRIFKYEF
jgi:hypothetical protein